METFSRGKEQPPELGKQLKLEGKPLFLRLVSTLDCSWRKQLSLGKQLTCQRTFFFLLAAIGRAPSAEKTAPRAAIMSPIGWRTVALAKEQLSNLCNSFMDWDNLRNCTVTVVWRLTHSLVSLAGCWTPAWSLHGGRNWRSARSRGKTATSRSRARPCRKGPLKERKMLLLQTKNFFYISKDCFSHAV